MWKWLRRTLVALLALVLFVVLIPLAGLAYGFLTTDDVELDRAQPAAAQAPAGEGIEGYNRPEESTFLTYPEWAIVYAAREYAEFVGREFPSRFPYWSYAGRFWQDYAMMIRASHAYPFNFNNHMMLVVIGTSHTIELAIQSLYENTLGRLSEAAAFWEEVPEDSYQAEAAAEYAAFLDQVPWYRFPYAEKRAGLWATPSAGGSAVVRSWERKLGFGAAYSIKQGYAALIASGLSAAADPALLDIHVWAAGPVADAISGERDTQLERDLGSEGAIFVTQRYQVFTEMIPRLIDRGLRFVEIGGNRLIFATFLAEAETALPDVGQVLFAYPLPAMPETRRIGIALPVGGLHDALPALDTAGARLEHVYDY